VSLFVRPRSGEKRSDPFAGQSLIPERAGSAPSGEPRSTVQAMQHTTVWACVNLIADLVSMLPVDEYLSDGGTGPAVPVAPSELTLAPSALVDAPVWLAQLLVSDLLVGNAYGLITAVTRRGWPSKVEWLDPGTVTPRIQGGELLFNTQWGLLRPKVDIVHVPAYVLPGTPLGMSPIGHFRRSIGIGLSAEDFGARWYTEGGHPSAIVSSDEELSPDQATAVKKSIRNTISGTREVAVLGGGLKYQAIQIPPGESLFLEAIGANSATISGQIYRVAPEMFGITQKGAALTYANREQRTLDFLMVCLGPWIRRAERAISQLLPRGRFVKLNTGALLATDLETRYKAHATGIATGFLSVNEARAWENLPGIGPDGDKYRPVDLATMPAGTPAK